MTEATGGSAASPNALARAALLETPDALLAAGVSKPVFDCRWPETRRVAERLWAALPNGLADRLYGAPYLGGQDAMHERFLDQWIEWRSNAVVLDPPALPHRYATAGSSEGIRECIAEHAVAQRSAGREAVMHMFEGEYEGYAAYADAYGVKIRRHPRGAWRESFRGVSADAWRGDLVVISEPSAIDGNLWAEFPTFIRHLERELPVVRIAVDLTYVGTVAREYSIDVTSPLIDTVFFSLSKVFGVYYHRIGGVLSRTSLPGLAGNRWFKNTFSLELGRELLAAHSVRAIPAAYAPLQSRAAALAGAALGLELVPSDAVLIAQRAWSDDLPAVVRPLRRGPALRCCLTPGLDRLLFPAGITGAGARGEHG